MQHTLESPNEIVSYLDSLTSEEQSGELVFQNDQQNAKVYLHGGSIVWAFASGQEESFQSILIREKRVSKEELLQGIKRARQQGKKSLDEILLTLGISDFQIRNSIIERHTKSALKIICNWPRCAAQFHRHTEAPANGAQGLNLRSLLGGILPAEENNSEQAPSINPQPAPSQTKEIPQAPSQQKPTRPSYRGSTNTHPVNNIDELLGRFRLEIPNFLAAMVIEGKTGMPIAVMNDAPELDVEAVSAFYRDVSKSALNALEMMGKQIQPECPLQEVLITSNDDYVLLQTLKNGEHLLYLLIDSDSNPGMARIVIRRYLSRLNEFLL